LIKREIQGVNRQLGHKGRPYSICLIQGGVNGVNTPGVQFYRLKEGTELKDGQSLDNDYNKVTYQYQKHTHQNRVELKIAEGSR
jgi:hypothetical protein